MSVAESEERSGENDAGERHQEYGQNLSVTEKSQHAASLFQGISKLHSERRRKHPIKDDSLGRKSHEKGNYSDRNKRDNRVQPVGRHPQN